MKHVYPADLCSAAPVAPPQPLPLPPYMRDHFSPSKMRTFFRFEPTKKMLKAGFPIGPRRLGTDEARARAIYEAEIRPVLDAFRENRLEISLDQSKPVYATLDWLWEKYKQTQRYRHLAAVTQGDYRDRIARCLNHILKSGTYKGQRFGGIPLKAISPAFADSVYDEYLPKQKTNDEGDVVEFNRYRTAKLDFQTLRAMVNGTKRAYSHLLEKERNPFAEMWMFYRSEGKAPVVPTQLALFVRKADEKGLRSVSALVLFAWELQVRVTHYPYVSSVADFRGLHHEKEVHVRSHKTHQNAYFYLFDDDGKVLYPMLTKRLDELKGNRSTGPLFVSEWSEQGKARAWRAPELREVMAEICKEAGLPHLTLSQFRKGGLSEAGAAGLTTSQIMSQSLHLTEEAVQIYIDKNAEVAMGGQQRRLTHRDKLRKRGIDIVT